MDTIINRLSNIERIAGLSKSGYYEKNFKFSCLFCENYIRETYSRQQILKNVNIFWKKIYNLYINEELFKAFNDYNIEKVTNLIEDILKKNFKEK